ncbi:hypothetical protein E2C01_057973 [Portunus trituberculatus]|uniref:Uncharacterized protein n=1 Tax=Portunus trituberculatus TaxID=210409 RepID=A0A5B7H1Y3_PORTR|nr:hypothetical protein [Portunus trituberculatus]
MNRNSPGDVEIEAEATRALSTGCDTLTQIMLFVTARSSRVRQKTQLGMWPQSCQQSRPPCTTYSTLPLSPPLTHVGLVLPLRCIMPPRLHLTSARRVRSGPVMQRPALRGHHSRGLVELQLDTLRSAYTGR